MDANPAASQDAGTVISEERARSTSGHATVLAWLPHWWSTVLFPGRSWSAERDWRWASLVWLVVLPAVLLYPYLGFALFEPDESRYAQIPREMLQRGEWIVPYLQGEPYLDKPPLLYWLVMGSYSICGVSEGAARLVPALALHLCILLTYFFGCRWVGERASFFGALLLGLAPGFMSIGRLLLLDGVLTLWTTLALFAAYEARQGSLLHWRWWVVSALACGLGVLTKGPIALILLVPPLLLQRWLSGNLCLLRRWAVLCYGLIVLLVSVPWYVAICVRIPSFVQYFVWEQNIQRYLSPYAHQEGVWYFAPILLGGLFPATLLLVPWVRFLLTTDASVREQRCASLGFLLLSGGWCLFFFTLSSCKLPTYILPAFPALALALGTFVVRCGYQQRRPFQAALVVAGVGLLLAHHVVIPWYAHFRSPIRQGAVLAYHCADPSATVVCYPRPCHAVTFFLDRPEIPSFRSKEIEDLRDLVRQRPQTIILCTHRHSLQGLRQLLPPEVEIVHSVRFGLPAVPGVPQEYQRPLNKLLGETALGLCDLAVVQRKSHSAGGTPGASTAVVAVDR